MCRQEVFLYVFIILNFISYKIDSLLNLRYFSIMEVVIFVFVLSELIIFELFNNKLNTELNSIQKMNYRI